MFVSKHFLCVSLYSLSREGSSSSYGELDWGSIHPILQEFINELVISQICLVISLFVISVWLFYYCFFYGYLFMHKKPKCNTLIIYLIKESKLEVVKILTHV